MHSLDGRDIEKIASCLSGHVLIREKEDDGTVKILHLLGLPLSDWFTKNALAYGLNQR
jgi:hypothetical protein